MRKIVAFDGTNVATPRAKARLDVADLSIEHLVDLRVAELNLNLAAHLQIIENVYLLRVRVVLDVEIDGKERRCVQARLNFNAHDTRAKIQIGRSDLLLTIDLHDDTLIIFTGRGHLLGLPRECGSGSSGLDRLEQDRRHQELGPRLERHGIRDAVKVCDAPPLARVIVGRHRDAL